MNATATLSWLTKHQSLAHWSWAILNQFSNGIGNLQLNGVTRDNTEIWDFIDACYIPCVLQRRGEVTGYTEHSIMYLIGNIQIVFRKLKTNQSGKICYFKIVM